MVSRYRNRDDPRAGGTVNRDPNALSAEAIERFGSDPLATFSANLPRSGSHRPRLARAGRERAAGAFCAHQDGAGAYPAFAFRAGIHTFGENKIQEAIAKRERCRSRHRLVHRRASSDQQGQIPDSFRHEFHALDSLRLADLLNARLEREDRVSTSMSRSTPRGEESKYGLHPTHCFPSWTCSTWFPG